MRSSYSVSPELSSFFRSGPKLLEISKVLAIIMAQFHETPGPDIRKCLFYHYVTPSQFRVDFLSSLAVAQSLEISQVLVINLNLQKLKIKRQRKKGQPAIRKQTWEPASESRLKIPLTQVHFISHKLQLLLNLFFSLN